MGPAGSPAVPSASVTMSPSVPTAPASRSRDQSQQPHPGPTDRAGIWLGVEAPVGGILVLSPARRAQRKAPHRRALAIVRKILDDREARAAVGAVGEGVLVPAIVGIKQLRAAGGTGGEVRRDQLVAAGFGDALPDREGGAALRRRLHRRARCDARARRRLLRQRRREPLDVERRPFGVDLHARRRVERPAGDAVSTGERIHVRTKTDALHHAAHAQTQGAALSSVCFVRQHVSGSQPSPLRCGTRDSGPTAVSA